FIVVTHHAHSRTQAAGVEDEQAVILEVISDAMGADLSTKFFRVRLRGVSVDPSLPPNSPAVLKNFPRTMVIHWHAFGNCVDKGASELEMDWYGSLNVDSKGTPAACWPS